jgi:hypothetical protein
VPPTGAQPRPHEPQRRAFVKLRLQSLDEVGTHFLLMLVVVTSNRQDEAHP